MPSLFDIANDIARVLGQVQTNTLSSATTEAAVKADTGDIRNSLHSLLSLTQAGFVSLSKGLAAAIDQQKATNFALDYERQQNDTIICWLTNIANVLCSSLHIQEQQLKVQASIDASVRDVKEILEIVHGNVAMEMMRRRELENQIHACCPPPKPDVAPCFQPCSEPGFKPYQFRVADYTGIVGGIVGENEGH